MSQSGLTQQQLIELFGWEIYPKYNDKSTNQEMRNLNKNEAKVLWAGIVLERLISSKDPLSMKELFSPRDDNDLEMPMMRKMAMSKDWQRKLMNRFIDEELAVKTGSARRVVYEIGNKKKAVGLLSKATNDTVYIKNLVWPDDYPLPRPEDEIPVPPIEGEPTVARGVGSDATTLTDNEEESDIDRLIRGVAAVIQISTNLFKKVDHLEKQIVELKNNQNQTNKTSLETKNAIVELTGTVKQTERSVETELELLGECDQKLVQIQELSSASADRTAGLTRICSSINKKVDNKTQLQFIELLAKVMEFSSRGKNLVNQMSTQFKKEEALFKEVEVIMKHLKQTNE